MMIQSIKRCTMKKYKIGDLVTGYVTGIEKYGIFINIDNECSGLIHISEISSTYVRNINDYVRLGEVIQAKIIDPRDKNHLKLSIKDINYRISNKKNTRIEETKSGFATLTSLLNEWIDDKIAEILVKNQ